MKDNENDISRRDALKAMAVAGLAAVTGLPTLAPAEDTQETNSPSGKLRAVAINGSPRNGNTEAMLKMALAPLQKNGWETELIQIGHLRLWGCQSCFKCHQFKDNTCAMENDGFNEIYQRILGASAILIGSPTYVADVSATTKAFIERAVFVALGNNFSLKGKIGAAVAVHRRAGAVNVFDTINHMFLIGQMIVPGSFYWNMGVGTDIGEVESDAEGKATMQHLGEVIHLVATAIQPFLKQWPEQPKFR